MDFRSVNLNLLASFDALALEKNVTRAAQRMGVTQSAMSNSLAQLRLLFGDELFVRTAHGVLPTPRALELRGPIQEGLQHLERALSPRSFDPATADRTFVLAASDHVELVVLPGLLRKLAKVAPRVKLEVRPWGLHEVPLALARGEADLMLGFYDGVPPNHHHEILFEEEYACIVRRGHPLVKKKLTLETYVALSHVLVSQRAGSPGSVDVALAKRGLSRTVGARVSHFLLAPVLVAQTDMVAAIDGRVADAFAGPLRLQRFPPPLPLPKGKVGQVWHEHHHTDPGHEWFRSLVRAGCQSP